MPLDGVAACMPGEPTPVETRDDKQSLRGLESEIDVGHNRKVAFRLQRLYGPSVPLSGKKLEPPSASPAASYRDIEVDRYPGRVLSDRIGDGRRSVIRAILIGNNLLFAQVEYSEAQPPDQAVIDAFLNSLRIEIPWRIYTAPRERFTVAVPRLAKVTEDDGHFESGKPRKAFAFTLGGLDARSFSVFVWPLPGSGKVCSEEEATGWEAKLAETGHVIQSPKRVTLGAFVGCEILWQDKDASFTRSRLFKSGNRGYVFAVEALRREAVEGADVDRFFDSVVLTDP